LDLVFLAGVPILTIFGKARHVSPSLPLSRSSVLIIVQVVVALPTRNISSYSLDELLNSTEEYARTRQRRQDDSEQVYIAANVTVEVLSRGFQLGDGRTYGKFQNYELDPDVSYNVGLRSTVEGNNTPMFAVGSRPFSESTEMGCALH